MDLKGLVRFQLLVHNDVDGNGLRRLAGSKNQRAFCSLEIFAHFRAIGQFHRFVIHRDFLSAARPQSHFKKEDLVELVFKGSPIRHKSDLDILLLHVATVGTPHGQAQTNPRHCFESTPVHRCCFTL